MIFNLFNHIFHITHLLHEQDKKLIINFIDMVSLSFWCHKVLSAQLKLCEKEREKDMNEWT